MYEDREYHISMQLDLVIMLLQVKYESINCVFTKIFQFDQSYSWISRYVAEMIFVLFNIEFYTLNCVRKVFSNNFLPRNQIIWFSYMICTNWFTLYKKRYNFLSISITGEETGPAWGNENKRVSGNRTLYSNRMTTNPFLWQKDIN